ncbi:hypothetical protein PRK78_004936 [Emydomyces testavorans]|uniref:non-specific serine/threonine protein kinase n=1 Tax=Emydomyces testavorans TaxID=2070801 RepID=A0AAF0DIW7_9EURO|nr:hypothetical protein PRK78_004936 [Emydomyces testavorans]
MPELDLTQTALIIKGGSLSAEHVLHLPQNRDRLVFQQIDVTFGDHSVDIDPESRECTPDPPIDEPELHLRFDGPIKQPSQGWRFGIDNQEGICDVLLGTRSEVRQSRKKISAKHFRIHFNFASGMLVLVNESQHGTTFSVRGQRGHTKLMGNGSRVLEATDVTIVEVADLVFSLHYPILDGKLAKFQHEANWRTFTQKYKDAIPGLGQIILSSSACTGSSSHRIGRCGGYAIFEEIGRGESGIFRRAIDRSGTVYAVKEFFKARREQQAQNLSEIATLQSLSHPNIVKYIDAIANEAGLFLIMEFMPLGDLKYQHRQKRVSRAHLIIIIHQVLAAIAYLHRIKQVHRAIKPESILLKSWDPLVAKLSDFGLTTRNGFLTTECGTKKYAAPEMFVGQYDDSVDVWSAGVSAFDIAEELPDDTDGFSHNDWAEEVQRRVTTAYKEKQDPFLLLLRKMLHMNPKARPSAEDCLSDPGLEPSPQDNEFDLDLQGHLVGQELATAMPTTAGGSDVPTGAFSGQTALGHAAPSLGAEHNHEQDPFALEIPHNDTELIDYTWHGEKFVRCDINSSKIVMRLSDGWIDFTHLSMAAGKPKKWIDRILRRIPRSQKEVYVHSFQRGTLIDSHLVAVLIKELGLENNKQLLQLINAQARVSQSGLAAEADSAGPMPESLDASLQNYATIAQSLFEETPLGDWPFDWSYLANINMPPQNSRGGDSDLNFMQGLLSNQEIPTACGMLGQVCFSTSDLVLAYTD